MCRVSLGSGQQVEGPGYRGRVDNPGERGAYHAPTPPARSSRLAAPLRARRSSASRLAATNLLFMCATYGWSNGDRKTRLCRSHPKAQTA